MHEKLMSICYIHMNGLLWNVHYLVTVVLRKQLDFKSTVIRSERSCSSLVSTENSDFELFHDCHHNYIAKRPDVRSLKYFSTVQSCTYFKLQLTLKKLFCLKFCQS